MLGLQRRLRRAGTDDILTLPVFVGAEIPAPTIGVGQGALCVLHADCHDGADLQRCDVALSVAEAGVKLPPGSVGIVAGIASATGLLNLPTLAGKSARLVGLAWDRTAVCADLDCPTDSSLADHAGRQLAIAARALGLPLHEILDAG